MKNFIANLMKAQAAHSRRPAKQCQENCELFCAAKADKRTRAVRRMAVAIFDPEVHGRAIKAAPTNYAPGFDVKKICSGRKQISATNRIFLRGFRICLPLVGQKLPDIAAHIE